MIVSDFEIDFSTNLLTCCMDEVMNNNSPAKEGMIIECSDCGLEMRLEKAKNGKLMWRRYDG